MPLETNGYYDFGPFTLRVRDKTIVAGDKAVDLGPMGVDVLMFLIANRDAFVSRSELARDLWKAKVSDDAIYRQISDIRKSLAKFDDLTEYIENKKGQGWRFVVPVETWTDVAAQDRSPAVDLVVALPQFHRKGWSWKVYAVVAAGVAIAAGAAVKIEGVLTAEPRITGYRQLTSDGFPKEGRLLTDGRLVYFTEHVSHNANSDARLAAAPVAGGEVTYPTAPVQPTTLLDIAARTGDRLYWITTHFDAGSTLVWRAKEGPLEPMGMETSYASISPDGHTLAYGDLHHNLYLRNPAGASTLLTIPVRGNARWLRWSPDGKRIRFSAFDPASSESSLWEVRRDGSNLRQLPIPVGEGKQLCSQGWTADGRYFIFSEYGSLDHRSSLWVVPDDAVSLIRLKPVRLSAALDFRSVVAAPDGSRIFAIGTAFRNELARFDLQKREFVPLWEGFPAIDMGFSHDGDWAAFARYPECTLWVSRADGSERRQITSPGLEAHQPHWSPDGRRIAFMGRMPGKLWQIYIVNVAGGVPEEVKPDDPFDQGVPSWSADGRSLVFGELRDRKPDAEMVIRVLDLRTGAETVLPGSKGKWSPRWSPDGRYILAQTTDFKELDLFDCKSQTWKPLARAYGDDATWSLNGRFVHFMASTERGRALFRVRVEDGKVEQLALQPEYEYSWSGVAPDGSPLTLRSVKIEEIYALDLRLP